MPKKTKRKGGMLIVQGVRAKSKHRSSRDHDPDDPWRFQLPKHVKRADTALDG